MTETMTTKIVVFRIVEGPAPKEMALGLSFGKDKYLSYCGVFDNETAAHVFMSERKKSHEMFTRPDYEGEYIALPGLYGFIGAIPAVEEKRAV